MLTLKLRATARPTAVAQAGRASSRRRAGRALLALLCSVLVTGAARAVLAQESCCASKPDEVKVSFKGNVCGSQDFTVTLANAVATGTVVNCSTNTWATIGETTALLTLNQTYTLTVGAGTCSTHLNFDVPPGYWIEINGEEKLTVDKSGAEPGGGDGTWSVVLRTCDSCEKDGPNGGDDGGGPGSESSLSSDGGVNFGVKLGGLTDGRSAGSIALREETLQAGSSSPSALVYSPPGRTSEVEVIRDQQTNLLRQVRSPQALADIVVINPSEYDIRFYQPSDVGAKTSGVYAVTGAPFVTWKVKNPDGAQTGRLQILKIADGVTETNEYVWDAATGNWSFSAGGGARTETTTKTYDVAAGERTEVREVKNGDGQLVYKVAHTYRSFLWGEELVRRVIDPGGAALTTTHAYYTDPAEENRYRRLQATTEPDGSWVRYDYDAHGNVASETRPWKDLDMASANESNARVSTYQYSNYDGKDVSLYPRYLSAVQETVEGTVTSRTTYRRDLTADAIPTVAEVKTDYAEGGDASRAGLVTTTNRFHASAPAMLTGLVSSITYPDQRTDTYAYEKGNFIPDDDPAFSRFVPDAGGAAFRVTTTHGRAGSPGGVAFKTTREVSVNDRYGRSVLAETYVYTGTNFERVTWTVSTYDGRGRLTQILKHNGQVSSAVWDGERKTSETGADGTETAYTYDSLGRVRTVTRKGVAAAGGYPAQPDVVTTYGYDATGNVLQESVAAGGLTLNTSRTYDVAGRPKTATDQAGLVTTYDYADGGRTQTVTQPGGATEVTEKYLDGQLKRVSGTAVVARFLDYGVEGDGRLYSQTYVGAAAAGSPRWVKATTDWLGREVRVETPSFTGEVLITTSVYNNKGQLQLRRVTSSSSLFRLRTDELFQYDEIGRQIRTGFDLNDDGLLTEVSTDRFVETTSGYEKTGGVWFHSVLTKNYLRDNDAASADATLKKRLTGFAAGGAERTVAESTRIDVAGNRATTTVLVDRAAKKVRALNSSSASSMVAESVTVNGLLQTTTAQTPEAATVYSYDAFGRQTSVNSPQAGPVTSVYDPATGQLTSATRGANIVSYEYYPASHPNAGQLKAQINAGGKKLYFEYNSRGEPTRTWGETAYPAEHLYNSYGQRTELHTFRGGSGWAASTWPAATAGAADVTRWVYHEPTGLLLQKQDAAGKGASYIYDLLGRRTKRTRARTDAGGAPLTTTYVYDAKTGELATISHSDATPRVSFIYERSGRPATITDGSGAHTLSYNNAGELLAEQTVGGLLDGVRVQSGYDNLLRRDGLQVSRGPSKYVQQGYGYDAHSRLATVTNGGRTATYTYHPQRGLLSATSFGGGTSNSRVYDAQGRLESAVTSITAGTVSSYTYTYNALDQRTKVVREDGSYWSHLYNDRGELASAKKYWADQTSVAGQQSEYAYDNIGNRQAARRGGDGQGAGLRESVYTANALNQYAQRTVPSAVDVMGMADAASTVTVNNQGTERKGEYFYKALAVENSAGPVQAQLSINAVKAGAGAGGQDLVTSEQRSVYLPAAQETYAYDADGNLTRDGRWSYAWDAEDRLTSMESVPEVPAAAKLRLEFSYDHAGRRVQKKIYGWNAATSSYQLQSATRFVYDGWNLLAELDGGNNLIRSYVWAGDELLLINGGGRTYQAGYDGNRNITALVNASDGTVSARYDYDPFGQTLRATGDYAAQNPLRFSGKYTDQETGLLYYGLRYYNPQTGRWISRDPSGESSGLNLYGFIDNDGVNATDFLGLWKREGSWMGKWYKYRAVAVAECKDTLRGLAELITGDPSDRRLLKEPDKIQVGQKIDVSPLLQAFEDKVRRSVVAAAPRYKSTFHYPMDLTRGNPEDTVNQFFQPTPFGTSDCQQAFQVILAKGLINVLKPGEFTEMGLTYDLTLVERASSPEQMLQGDVGYIKNWEDYPAERGYRGEWIIKLAPGKFYGFPDGTKSMTQWYNDLAFFYLRDTGGRQPTGLFPGFQKDSVLFIDIAGVSEKLFDLRVWKKGQ